MTSDTAQRHQQFLALLDPERDALWRYCRRMCWDSSSAEDVLQDAVLVAWRRFDSFTLGTSFRAWTFRILSNTILNANTQLNRSLKRQVLSENLDLVSALEKEEAYDQVLADPDRLLAQVGDEVRGAVKSLPPAERMVFLLRSVEGFAYKEIAGALEIPMGTVMSHLFRARARLREFLAEYVQTTGFARKETSP